MNFFKKLGEFFNGSSSTPENVGRQFRREAIDRLNDVLVLRIEDLEDWFTNLEVEQGEQIAEFIQQHAGLSDREASDRMKFLSIVKYLLERNPGTPMWALCGRAEAAMNPLSSRLASFNQPQWTELELDRWIDGLDDHYQPQVLDKLRQYRAAGLPSGPKLVEFLCGVRRSVERCQQEEAEESGNGMGLLHAWYIWQEERRKEAQQQYFERENRKARGY